MCDALLRRRFWPQNLYKSGVLRENVGLRAGLNGNAACGGGRGPAFWSNEWLKPGREAALKRAERFCLSGRCPPAKAGGKKEPAKAG